MVQQEAGQPGFNSQQGQVIFLYTTAFTGRGANAFYPVGKRGFFPGVMWLGHEANHSKLHLMEEWLSYAFTPPYVFMLWCLIN
jgi:hypothetical protein